MLRINSLQFKTDSCAQAAGRNVTMASEPADGRGVLFAPIVAPRIKSISREAVLAFQAAREAYEDACSSQPGMKAVSYRSCFNPIFLKSLIRARAFGSDVKNVGDLTDEKIKSKLEDVSGCTRTVSVESTLNDVKAHVRLDVNEPDARLRILMLSASYLELCERRGWKFVETSPKAAIKHIISVLQPPGLKTRMIDSLQLERADLKNDYFGFMDFLSQKAQIFEEVQPLKKLLKTKPSNSSPPGRGQHSSRTVVTSKPDKKGIPRSTISKADRVNAQGNLPDRLNPKCSGKHYVKYCRITGKELAKKLLADFREKQRQERKALSSVSSSGSRLEPIPKKTASAKSHDDKSAVVSAEIGDTSSRVALTLVLTEM